MCSNISKPSPHHHPYYLNNKNERMREVNRWIEVNYNRLLENATKITHDVSDAGDVLHICILALLEYPADKQVRLYNEGKLENYITICVNRQWKSATSPYHNQHRKQSQRENEYIDWKHDKMENEEMSEYDEMCDCALRELDNLHFYFRILVQDKYVNGLTYQQMNEKYRISKNSLLKDVKEGLEMLKLKCEK